MDALAGTFDTLTDLRRRFDEATPRPRVAVIAAVLALLLVAVVAIVRLTASDDDTVDAYIARSGLKGHSRLRVGVFNDQPLLGYAEDKTSTRLADHEGFDTEVARYLAAYLGYSEESVELVDTQVQNRNRDLDNGRVDVVIASFSMTDEREKEVDFAGPYLRSQPEVLMRANDPRSSGSLSFRELSEMGKHLCTVGSSTSDSALRERQNNGFEGAGASGGCVQGLLDGTFDAFMLDDVVLAGYEDQYHDKLKMADLVFDQKEDYGIAVRNGDEALRQVIGNFLWDSYERGDNGAWQRAWNKTLGRVLKDDRPQPEPRPYKRLRDYRDRIRSSGPLGGRAPADRTQPPAVLAAAPPARPVRRRGRPR